jgi:hypothetical protein
MSLFHSSAPSIEIHSHDGAFLCRLATEADHDFRAEPSRQNGFWHNKKRQQAVLSLSKRRHSTENGVLIEDRFHDSQESRCGPSQKGVFSRPALPL